MKFKALKTYKNSKTRGILFKLMVFPIMFPLCLAIDICDELEIQ